MQTEKDSLKRQYEATQRELTVALETTTELTAQLYKVEKDNLVLKNKAEDASHRLKVEVTDVKMQMLKERGDLERQQDRYANQIEGTVVLNGSQVLGLSVMF